MSAHSTNTSFYAQCLKSQYQFNLQVVGVESNKCKNVTKWKDWKSKEQLIKEMAENALLAAKAANVPPASPDPKPSDKTNPKAQETVLGKHPSSSKPTPPPAKKQQVIPPATAVDKTPPAAEASKPSKPQRDAAVRPPPPPAAGTVEGDSKPAAQSVVLSTRTQSSVTKHCNILQDPESNKSIDGSHVTCPVHHKPKDQKGKKKVSSVMTPK
jgi:hypothetical protein